MSLICCPLSECGAPEFVFGFGFLAAATVGRKDPVAVGGSHPDALQAVTPGRCSKGEGQSERSDCHLAE